MRFDKDGRIMKPVDRAHPVFFERKEMRKQFNPLKNRLNLMIS